MKNLISDLHVHSGLKGYGLSDQPDSANLTIWDYYPERKEEIKKLNFVLRGAIKDMAKDSQANLNACAEAGLMMPFIALYPIERQMFAMDPQKPFRNLFRLLLKGKQHVYLGSAVTGFPESKVQAILNNVANGKDDGVHYFNQLLLERNYLLDQTQTISPEGFKFQFAQDYKELKSLLRTGNTIASMLTVEGAHSFGNYLHNSTFKKEYEQLDDIEKNVLRTSFIKNITAIKKAADQKPVPFFVTFCHHFNNLLAGHARSFSDKSNLIGSINWPNVPGMRHLFNQEPGLNKGITKLGQEVIELLYDKDQGKRILIDAKHMSVNSRKEFYQYIRNRREKYQDPIPIIQSHTAINGWATLDEAAQHEETSRLDKDQFFSRWQINLTNEDILEIHDSDGLIGVVLHEGRMPGDGFKAQAKKLKKKIKKARKKPQKKAKYEQELQDLYVKLIWSNIFHIVKTVKDQRQGANGWKMIALGSDYDGLVDPIDAFDTVANFKNLRQAMIDYIKAGKAVSYAEHGEAKTLAMPEVQSLLFGQTLKEILDNIFFGNTDLFLSKYFTADYLEKTKPVTGPKEISLAA